MRLVRWFLRLFGWPRTQVVDGDPFPRPQVYFWTVYRRGRFVGYKCRAKPLAWRGVVIDYAKR